MSEAASCPECRGPLTRGPGAGCPACLLRRGLMGYDGEAEPAPAAVWFGDYELIEEIAAGGMGVVWRARQAGLGREVALKLIRAGQFARPEERARFRNEAEAVARLRHPGIVAIHEVGEVDGHPFFSMDLIAGTTLARALRDRPMPARAAARCLRLVAEAIHYAHARGVFHRDLKPGNILLDEHGAPHVSDFGLAKLVESDTDLTRSGTVLGSPGYMPPEQAQGRLRDMDARADVYSLGAVLYEMLTGRPPFQAATTLETLRLVIEQEPVAPRTHNPGLPRDLETLCLKCLAKGPAQRYATAGDLAEELGRFLRDEPILARPASALEKLWRWRRRQPALAATGAALVVALVAGLAATSWQWLQARAAHERQQQANRELRQANEFLHLQRMHDLIGRNNFSDTLPQLARIVRTNPTNRLAAELLAGGLASQRWVPWAMGSQRHTNDLGWAWFDPPGDHVVSYAQESHHVAVFPIQDGEPAPATAWVQLDSDLAFVAFPPAGRLVCVGCSNGVVRWINLATGADARPPARASGVALTGACRRDDGTLLVILADGSLEQWETNAPSRIAHRLPAGLSNPSFNAAGTRLAAEHDRRLKVWDTRSGRLLAETPRPGGSWAMAWDTAGERLAAFSSDSGWCVLVPADLPGTPVPPAISSDTPSVDAAAFSHDGTRLATAHADRTLRFWELPGGKRVEGTLTLRHRLTRLLYLEDSGELLGHDAAGNTQVWDTRSGSLTAERPPLPAIGNHRTWAVHPGRRRLLRGSGSGYLFLMSLERRAREVAFEHPAPVRDAVISSDGRLVASVASDGAARVWSIAQPGAHLARVTTPGPAVLCRMAPDSATVVLAGEDGTARLWKHREPGTNLVELRHQDQVWAAEFSPDGRIVATGSRDGTARLWDTTGRALSPSLPHGSWVSSVVFRPDGRALAVAGYGRTTQLRAVPDGRLLLELPTSAGVSALVFTPDGRRLVAGHYNGGISVWDAETGDRLDPPLARQLRRGRVNALAVSQDGKHVLWGTMDGTAAVRPIDSSNTANRVFTHEGSVISVAFLAGSRRIATGTEAGIIVIWDLESELRLRVIAAHSRPLVSMRPTPDGNAIVSASHDGWAIVHDVHPVPLPAPAWLPEMAEYVAGLAINPQGGWEFAELSSNSLNFLMAPPKDSFARSIWRRVVPANVRTSVEAP